MKRSFKLWALLVALGLLAWWVVVGLFPAPKRELVRCLWSVAAVVQPAAGRPAPTVSGRVVMTEAEGSFKSLAGQSVEFAWQAPDRLRVAGRIQNRLLTVGRDGNELWVHAPDKQFGVVGKPGVPRFSVRPTELDTTQLEPVRLTVSRWRLLGLVLLLHVTPLPDEAVGNVPCRVLEITGRPALVRAGRLPPARARLWVRAADALPARLHVDDGKGGRLEAELQELTRETNVPSPEWKLCAPPEHHIETVAVSHLRRFFPAALSLLRVQAPTLRPARGERVVVATAGDGRLELHDDTRVLFLKGSPEAMGCQHGLLLRAGVHNLVDRILYGVGVGSSFDKGRWFFGEIERAQAAVQPFMDPRNLQEMDALADAAGLDRQEVRLANIFPELFHCSGFALMGTATAGGRIFHGRILDYMKGVGLEPNAVVIVHQPDYGHAWVNVSYAGFVGSVTAMNEQHISIGEMGGRGEGRWQGKPMAQLVREVMEKASTLEEAIEIMRRGPRTCEYYYVIADGRARTAVGIAATPDTFELVRPGQAHPLLPHAVPDTVLLSAGARYETLVARVREGFGRFDAERARDLMKRPVAMISNIHRCSLRRTRWISGWPTPIATTWPATRATPITTSGNCWTPRCPTERKRPGQFSF